MNNLTKPKTSLVVVADSKKARIFEKIGHKKNNKKFDLNIICEIDAELDSQHEKPGRTFNSIGSLSMGSLRHAIEPHTDRRQVEKHKFAEKISNNLAELEKDISFDSLILIASHKVLEEIEKTLTDQLGQKTTHKLAKNLVAFADNEIKEYLENNLV